MTSNQPIGKSNTDGAGGTHLVVITDVLLRANFDVAQITQCLDSIVAFGNAFLMRSGVNRLTMLGSNSISTTILYHQDLHGSNQHTIKDQQNETFANVTATFHQNFLLWTNESMEKATEQLNAKQKQKLTGSNQQQSATLLPGSIAQALCMINAEKAAMARSRIVVFSIGADKSYDYSSQYMKLINCFFAAQKMDVIIDAATIELTEASSSSSFANGPDSNKMHSNKPSASMEELFAVSILQQGCDLTGGRYIQIHKVSTLMQHLLWIFITEAEERTAYVLPPKLKIAPPAACFCHRKPLEIGYVCSVCVSIFCQYTPFCSTCNSNLGQTSLKQIAHLKKLNLDEKTL